MSDYIRKFLFNYKVQAAIIFLAAFIISLSLLSYNDNDPSFNVSTDKISSNIFGKFGSYAADLLIQLFGLSSFILPIFFLIWGVKLYRGSDMKWLWLKIIFTFIAMLMLSTVIADFKMNNLPADCGGAIGILLHPFIASYEWPGNFILCLSALCLLFYSLSVKFEVFANLSKIIYLKANFYWQKWRSMSLFDYKIQPTADIASIEQKFQPIISNRLNNDINDNQEKIVQEQIVLREPVEQLKEESAILAEEYKPVKSSALHNKGLNYSQVSVLPSLDLLRKANTQHVKMESGQELKAHADDLISVLSDFGVKGQIGGVKQGPVVTLYEFEPAAGTKSSRVIGLADDIARSLSALSTRIAVVPGRNALGIELPNKQREFFCLRELIETPEYQDPSILLPIVLGKDLGGKSYVADLAKMPHLLVAGTTGSGKSVAINAMIISLLYRYTPAQCRLIMIDPKMLELSAYDNIPHLLTPVVTEPGKAVVALKWAVKEMENRYRLMSNVGVRNIAGYNAKVKEALESGKAMERTVQTGFDPETGRPIYESVTVNMESLPFIVIIVDEMADLMIVAGKDIEGSIQRLAQMARAAGIHIIMATQRPSVDVITGVIKANFPSRISFKVTSRIDSRTILGEQGSEQLLGMGDMLYMGNSSRIIRIHGPFVDDNEVEKVTNFLRNTGVPEYVSAVTEIPDEDKETTDDLGDGSDDDTIYRKALQIVKTERKVSISYIQRCLRIGYNRAATTIERMEREGVISPPNHSGKREILIDD